MDEMKSRLDYSDLPPLNLDANKVVILGVGKDSSRQTNYVIITFWLRNMVAGIWF